MWSKKNKEKDEKTVVMRQVLKYNLNIFLLQYFYDYYYFTGQVRFGKFLILQQLGTIFQISITDFSRQILYFQNN